MNDLVGSSRSAAVRTLILIIVAAVTAWILFVLGQYLDVLSQSRADPETVSSDPSFSSLVTVAAIAVLGLGALVGRRRLAALRVASAARSALADPVMRVAGTVLIIASALAAYMVIVLFLTEFYWGGDAPAPLQRTLGLYLPILACTVLVLVLILAGFVFAPSTRAEHTGAEQTAGEQTVGEHTAAEHTAAEHTAAVSAPAGLRTGAPPAVGAPAAQRHTALAYAIPITTAAAALLAGLLVYDLTGTSLQVWVWVLILTLVAAGVLLGTWCGAAAVRTAAADPAEHTAAAAPPLPGVIVGATRLNAVLVIVFTAIVSTMSLGYASSAVQGLHISPGVSIYVYEDAEPDVLVGGGEGTEISDPRLSASGWDLARGSQLQLALGDTTIAEGTVDGNRWAEAEGALPENLGAGEHTVQARGTAADGAAVDAELPMTVSESGTAVFPAGTESQAQDTESRLMSLSAGWAGGDLLPAGVLLLVVLALIAAALTVRNRDAQVSRSAAANSAASD